MVWKRSKSLVLSVAIGSLAVALASAALPVNADVGDAVAQGKVNRVDRKTVLSGSATAKPMLRINNAAPDGIGIRVNVAPGQPPLAVNSDARVKNLNADYVDGLSAADLVPGGVPPAGMTLRGTFAMGASAGTVGDLALSEISFGYVLAGPPTVHFILLGDKPPASCPGSASSPQAAPGHLCVYESELLGAGARNTNGDGGDGSAYAFGARLFVRSAKAGDFYSMGTWAVTAVAIGVEPDVSILPGTTLGIAD